MGQALKTKSQTLTVVVGLLFLYFIQRIACFHQWILLFVRAFNLNTLFRSSEWVSCRDEYGASSPPPQSRLHAQHRAWTLDLVIKSHMLSWLGRPGAPHLIGNQNIYKSLSLRRKKREIYLILKKKISLWRLMVRKAYNILLDKVIIRQKISFNILWSRWVLKSLEGGMSFRYNEGS